MSAAAVIADSAVADVAENESSLPDVNVAYQCALKGSVTRFIQCFEDEEDPYHEIVTSQVNERDGEARSPLDMAAALGHAEMVKELVARGAEVNSITVKGIAALHRAATWGKLDALKRLVDAGADMQQRTSWGERPRDTALRYGHVECVDYLDWAEAKLAFIRAIADARDTMADPEKVQGRFSRDDKTVINNTCNEKQQWLDTNPEATTLDFILQKKDLEDTLAPIWVKLTEPPHSGHQSVSRERSSYTPNRSATTR